MRYKIKSTCLVRKRLFFAPQDDEWQPAVMRAAPQTGQMTLGSTLVAIVNELVNEVHLSPAIVIISLYGIILHAAVDSTS